MTNGSFTVLGLCLHQIGDCHSDTKHHHVLVDFHTFQDASGDADKVCGVDDHLLNGLLRLVERQAVVIMVPLVRVSILWGVLGGTYIEHLATWRYLREGGGGGGATRVPELYRLRS
ncbi:hypothetical protein F5146DRAFT_1003245 [Armillaria mellea]|nr:hypothetical protein F5146DRAFT_1003245 [Armillaria mellea]